MEATNESHQPALTLLDKRDLASTAPSQSQLDCSLLTRSAWRIRFVVGTVAVVQLMADGRVAAGVVVAVSLRIRGHRHRRATRRPSSIRQDRVERLK